MANQTLATIQSISGKAFARNDQGEMRELAVGDKLLEGETLVTSPGGTVQLEMVDGSPLAITEPEVAITRDLVEEQAATREESAVEDASIAQVLQALEADVDLSEALEATAAGGGAGNDGNSFIRLGRIVESTDEFTIAPGSDATEAALVEDQQNELIPVPSVSISDATVVEGDIATLTITLSEPSTLPVSVSFSTRENSAGSEDFVSDSGIVTFAPGQTSIDIQVQTIADGIDEPLEAFDVVLTDFINGDSSDDAGQVTILPSVADPVEPADPIDPIDPVEPPVTTVPPGITGFNGGFGDPRTFLESALPDGTQPNPADLTRSGSFTITAEAGFSYVKIEDITIVEGDGSDSGQFIPVVFEKDGFSVNIADAQFNPESNSYTINYSVTLLDNSAHAAPGLEPTDLSRVINVPFKIEVQDKQQQTIETVRSAAVADDGPIAEDDSASLTVTDASIDPTVQGNVVEGSATAGGSIAGRDNLGADGGAVTEVTGSEPDNDGNPLTAQGLYGELVIAADGSYSYNLAPEVQASLVGGQTLTDVFTYVLTDGDGDIDVNLDPDAEGNTGEANLTITINKIADPVNTPPDALDDSYQTQEGILIDVPAQGVLANDGDADGDSISIVGDTTIVTDNGVTVVLNPDGSFRYTPEDGFTGTDTFEYTISDGVNTDTATVSVVVVPVNGPSIVEVRGLSNPFNEAHLTQGSSPTPEALTREGNLTIQADAQLQSLTIEGEEILDGEGNLIVGKTIANDEVGVIQVTFNSLVFDAENSSYVINYTVELTGEFDHSGTADTVAAPFTVVAQDINGRTSTITRSGGLRDDNPDAQDDANSVNGEVQTTAGNVLANGSSLDVSDTLGADGAVVSSVSFGSDEKEIGDGPSTIDGVYGTLNIGADGTYSYTLFNDENTQAAVEGLSAGAKLTEVFNYTLTDGDTDADQAKLTITINGDNSPPVGNPDPEGQQETYEVNEDSILTVSDPALGVLANDTDPDVDDVLTAINATDPAHGSVVLNSDGTFTYTPDADYNGPDSFTYQASDGVAITDPVTVSLNVSPVGDAVDDSVSTVQNTAVTIDVFGGSTPTGAMADNFEDPDAAVLQLITTGGSSTTQVTTDNGGTATLNTDGTVNYLPATGFTGTDTFQYEVKSADGNGNETATVTVDVTPASGPSLVSVLGISEAFNEANLPLGSSPTPGELQRPGSMTIQADAMLKSITVEGQELLDSAGNLVPQTVANNEVGVIEVSFSTLDFDDTTNTYTLNYTIGLSPSASFDHSSADLSVDVPFDITVQDVNDRTASATRTGSLLDDTPTAKADGVVPVLEDTATDIDVFANDTAGADGVDLATGVSLTGTPSKGVAVYNGDGTFTYTPGADTEGPDSFTYTIVDGDGDSATATVSVNIDPDSVPTVSVVYVDGAVGVVNEAALDSGGSDPTSTAESTSGSFTIAHSGTDTTGKFEIADKDGTLIDVTAGGVVVGDYGTLTVTNTAGEYTWGYALAGSTEVHPDTDSVGTAEGIQDRFALTVTDSDGDKATDSLTVTILDDGPTAKADGVVPVLEDTATDIDVFANDTAGADGVDLATGVSLTGAPTKGVAVYNGDGTFTYTPSADAEGADSFTYTIVDGDGDSATATVSVNISSDSVPTVSVVYVDGAVGVVNEAALDSGGSDPTSTAESTSGSFTIAHSGTDTTGKFEIADKDGTLIDVTAGGVVVGDYGTLTVTNTAGEYTWGYALAGSTEVHPDTDSVGTAEGIQDRFALTVTDSDGDKATDSLTVTILDDGPTAKADGVVPVLEDTATDIDVFANDTAGADGVDLATGVSLTGTPSKGVAVYNGDGTFTYTPGADAEGPDSFTYTIVDGDGDSATATVSVNIDPDSVPTVSVVYVDGAVGVVNEAALDSGGSDPTSTAESTSGSFTIGHSGTDTTGKFEIADKDGTLIDVTAGGVVVGDYGTLTVTNTAGEYTWGYALAGSTEVHPDTDSVGTAEGIQDRFALTVTDSDGDKATDSLTVTILDDGPTAKADGVVPVLEDTATDIDVFANDTAGADGVDLATGVSLTGAPTKGVAVYNGDGTFTYTPSADAEGADSFTYTIVDGDGDSATATVSVNISSDSVPTVSVVYVDGAVGVVNEAALDSGGSDPTSTAESTSGSFTIAHSGTDTTGKFEIADKDGTLIDVTAGGVVVGDYGTLTVTNTAGEYTWGYALAGSTEDHLDTDSVGTAEGIQDSFALTVTDSDGDTATDSLTVTILDDGPTAMDDPSVVVNEDSTININVYSNDVSGADGVDLVTGVEVSTGPSNGTLIYKDNGTFDYEPDGNFNGTDQFTYTITDADGDSDTATVDIVVAPVADPPTAKIEVKYITLEQPEFVLGADEVTLGDEFGDDNVFDENGNAKIETDQQTFFFGLEYAGSLVDLQVSAQIAGSWNFDGDGPVFEDNWSMTVDGRSFGPFQYNSEGKPGNANDNVNVIEVINIEGVPIDSKGNVVLNYSAITTETLETVTINTTATLDLPDTYVYEVDISAATVTPGESLSVRVGGTNSGTLTSLTGNTIVTETPAGSGIWDISFVPADPNNPSISDTLELRILEPAEFTLELIATSADGLTSTATTTVNSGPWEGSVIDGIVEGMKYSTSSGLHGFTDSEGSFQYRGGDTITFSVGAVVLGSFSASAMSDGMVFLQEIAGVGLNDLNNDYVENMAVFLQSMDNDGDAYNGIVISDGMHEAFSDEGFDLANMSKSDLQEVLLANGLTPVSEDDAMMHVRDMIIEHAGITEFDARESAGESLFATAGDDVFAFALSETGETTADVSISGFGASGTDALDLSDVLIGEEEEGADLSSYLNVSFDGTDTIVEVSSAGAFTGETNDAKHVDQTITLEGVDLVGSHGLDAVIQDMLSSGKLIVDQ